MLSLHVALTALLCLAPSPQEPDSLARDQVVGSLGARLDSQLTRFAAYGFSGAVLVVRDRAIVLLKGYGLADIQRGVPNTGATVFEMNSMTKMFTGVAILGLAAEGRLSLSDPVSRYLAGFPPAKQGATIEQLAMHTSGLVVEGSTLAGESLEAFLRDVARTPRESAPGKRYRYSNAGFSLLAAVIESVSGETYEDYLRRHLFGPAGMRSATFRPDVPPGDRRFAHGYVGTAAALVPGPPNPYIWGTRGAGGVWGTVGDMYRWLIGLEERRVLPDAQWRILRAPAPPPAKEAFGWHVDTAPDGRPRIQKGGGSDDFASHFLYYPRDRVTIVWACNNLRQRWRQTLNQSIPGLVFSNASYSLPPVAAMTPDELASRAGRYVAERDTLELRSGTGYLYAIANQLDIPTNVMFFPSDGEHFTAFDPAIRAVTRLSFGNPAGSSASFALADGRSVSVLRSTGDR